MTRMPLLVPIFGVVCAAAAAAQDVRESADGLWRRQSRSAATTMPLAEAAQAAAPGSGGDVYELNLGALDARLSMAPHENRVRVEVSPVFVSLPLPDGTFSRFAVAESPILEPALAARFPEIRTYALAGVDRPSLRGRLEATPHGIHAMVLTGEGTALVDPLPGSRGVLYRSRTDPGAPIVCGVEEGIAGGGLLPPATRTDLTDEARSWTAAAATPASGGTLRTYRMAVATTGEYYQARGGNDLDVLASIVVVMNRVNLVFQTEVAVSFVLAANTTDLFFTDKDADGYANDNECVMRSENVAVVTAVLDDGEYDIAHVFGSGAGGCAGGGNVCTASRANGASNLDTNPVRALDHDGFSGYRLVAHELGHQFGAGHTWSGTGGDCTDDQFSAGDAYEPGSGTTLMSYSGTCDWSNIQTTAPDPYFHTHSFDEIAAFLGGDGSLCGTAVATGNTAPDVSAGSAYTIPRRTPFVLTGSAADAEGHGLTFSWEQHDLAPGPFAPGIDPGAGPLFRSFPPVPDASRTFPRLADLVSNTSTPGELLPQSDRVDDPLTFRLTARDGFASGGGVGYDTVEITVEGEPFRVTSPNEPVVLHAGCTAPITWDIGGGSIAPRVDISISSDGGFTYSPLALGVANDGAHDLQLTCSPLTRGRLRIAAVDHIFFDISDGDFMVVNDSPVIEAAAQGGAVDGRCQLAATFTATVTDDCGLSAAGITVNAAVQGGSADLSNLTFNARQVDERTVGVDGSALVSNVTGGPATVQFAIDAADTCGQSDGVVVAAEVSDRTPPTIEVALTPTVLWPPNHRMVDVAATVAAADNCPGVRYVLTSVTSSDPDDAAGRGGGARRGDIHGADVMTPDTAFQVRAARQGAVRGRTYTAVYTAIDGSGNETAAAAVVAVPGRMKGR